VTKKKWALTDSQVDEIIGNLLRAGVIVASIIVLIGGGLYLKSHGTETPHYHIFNGEPSNLRSIPEIIRNASAFHGRAVIQFGLLLLIATPVMRVAFAALSFLLIRDRIYVGVTLIVLALLLFSLAGGGH
jgi:uncharacterized membrane protein